MEAALALLLHLRMRMLSVYYLPTTREHHQDQKEGRNKKTHTEILPTHETLNATGHITKISKGDTVSSEGTHWLIPTMAKKKEIRFDQQTEASSLGSKAKAWKPPAESAIDDVVA